MAEELGKIEKPEAEQFKEKRKLCLVPLIYWWQGAPEEYNEKLKQYWQQVTEYLNNLESKIGNVCIVYHETITLPGEEGLNLLEKLNPSVYQIAIDKCKSGAEFKVVEDKELVEESMDWERHLMMGFISRKVANMVSGFFTEASKKRFEYIGSRIDETLKENEAAILFIREGHMIQFPPDLEVFIVAPPILDEIRRWLRDYSEKPGEEEQEEKEVKEES
jgi:hypothetical protein